MTSIPGVGSSNQSSSGTTSGGVTTTGNDLRNVDLNQFLGLLITEIQNQDPLNPMDNAQMLTQLSQIRQIGSTNELSSTLRNFSVGQQLSMASNIIGRKVSGLDTNAKEITGVVDKVTVQTDSSDPSIRKVSVHIGDSVVDMSNIREIVSQ
jgi:flagellar basal-body rod modification protein FlgD